MSKGEVLITDSLFIFDEHVRQIEASGYSVTRLDKPKATEKELCQAIKGKVGYILGGVEQVTDKVIDAADRLKVISFTGAGFTEFIPGHDRARNRGIAITAAKGGNADAVAELAITFILMGLRKIPQLTSPNGPSFATTKSANESVLGIVGYGSIGKRVAELANALGFSVLVCNRTVPEDVPSSMRSVKLDDLLKESDVVTLHVDKVNGEHVIDAAGIARIREGAALVNTAFLEAVEIEAVEKAVADSRLTYLADHPISFSSNVPAGVALGTNAQTAFNTHSALRRVSNQTTKSLLSVLETGADDYRVL